MERIFFGAIEAQAFHPLFLFYDMPCCPPPPKKKSKSNQGQGRGRMMG